MSILNLVYDLLLLPIIRHNKLSLHPIIQFILCIFCFVHKSVFNNSCFFGWVSKYIISQLSHVSNFSLIILVVPKLDIFRLIQSPLSMPHSLVVSEWFFDHRVVDQRLVDKCFPLDIRFVSFLLRFVVVPYFDKRRPHIWGYLQPFPMFLKHLNLQWVL